MKARGGSLFSRLFGRRAKRQDAAPALSCQDDPGVSFYSEINCLRLGPLKDLAVADLRVLISQRIGLEYLVPLALGHLERDPMVSGISYPAGMYHPGDLCESVQRLPPEFWERHPDLLARWQKIRVSHGGSPPA
jgi:hypothetical protein